MTTPDDSQLTSRRSFVVTGAAARVALRGAPYIKLRRAPYDLVIRGGTVFDGTGAAGIQSDVGIAGGKLTAVARKIADRGTEEIAARGLPYATHMRNEDDQLLEAIDEAIAVARGAGCPLEISHLKCEGQRNWNKLDAVFGRVADARKTGMDVTFDCYPY